MRTDSIRLDPTVEDNMTGCPCGKLIDEANGYSAEVICWRDGDHPSGTGITVSAGHEWGREIAYVAMAEVVAGWPMQDIHIYYADGVYEFVSGPRP